MPTALNQTLPAQPDRPMHAYLVGPDGEGHWVAMETHGLAGGIFRTQRDAVRHACRETGCRASDVALAAGPVRFRLS